MSVGVTFDDAIAALERHLANDTKQFERGTIATDADVTTFQDRHGVMLSAHYRTFITTVGASRLFIDERGNGIDFIGLDQLQAYSERIFYNFGDDLFPDLLLIASLPGIGAWGGLIPSTDDPDFALLWPDTDPATWNSRVEETYIRFSKWIVEITKSSGEKVVP